MMTSRERLERALADAKQRQDWEEVERAQVSGATVAYLASRAASVGCSAFEAGHYELAARALRLSWTTYRSSSSAAGMGPAMAATGWYFGDGEHLLSRVQERLRDESATPDTLAEYCWKARACGADELAREASHRILDAADAWRSAIRAGGGPIAACADFLAEAHACQVLYWADGPGVATAVDRAKGSQRCSRAARVGDWNLASLRKQVEAIHLLLTGDRTSCLRAAEAARDSLASTLNSMDNPADFHDRVLLRIRALGRAGDEGRAEYESFVRAFPALESLVRP